MGKWLVLMGGGVVLRKMTQLVYLNNVVAKRPTYFIYHEHYGCHHVLHSLGIMGL